MPSCKMFQVKAEIVNTIGTPTDIVIKLFCLKDTGQILNAKQFEREREREREKRVKMIAELQRLLKVKLEV